MQHYLSELTSYGVLDISGDDRISFLQGQLTNDIHQLTADKAQLSCCCDPKGRVISLMYLFHTVEAVHAVMPLAMIEVTKKHLSKYAKFSKVTLKDVSQHWCVLGFASVTNFPKQALSLTEQYHVGIATPSVAKHQLTEWPNESESVWCADLVRANIAGIYPESSGEFIPQAIGLDKLGAISFNKGCYTGQEIIARLHYKGTNKYRLIHGVIQSDERLPAASKVINSENQTVGQLIRSSQIAQGEWICLIMVNKQINSETLSICGNELRPCLARNNEAS